MKKKKVSSVVKGKAEHTVHGKDRDIRDVTSGHGKAKAKGVSKTKKGSTRGC